MEPVAPKMHTPTVRLRRLAAELRRLRAGSELSRESVSQQTGINETTLYRIETARTRPQARTLVALLDLYGVEPEQREQLLLLSKESAQRGWLRSYHEDLPETYTAYISFETEAAGVRNYESLYIPGLLQTEDYARAVIRAGLPMATQDQVEHRVQARIERQQVLTKSDALRFWAIVDEAALRRQAGGAEVMLTQLGLLVDAVTAPNVTLQVIPFDKGAHAGMPGAFQLLDFRDPFDTDLIYIDNMAGDLFLESPADVSRYTMIFDTLRAIALSPDDSTAMIAELVENKR